MALARDSYRFETAEPVSHEDAQAWLGMRVDDLHGSPVGRLEDVWVDAASGDPAWLLVKEGRFAGGEYKLIPFTGCAADEGRVLVPFDRELVRAAPSLDSEELGGAELSRRLQAHYGVDGSDSDLPWI